MHWVRQPTRHDGGAYRELVKQNPNHYLAWVLILQVACRCNPRWHLVTSKGTQMNGNDLFIRTDVPAKVFDEAFNPLCAIGWLEHFSGKLLEESSESQGTLLEPQAPSKSIAAHSAQEDLLMFRAKEVRTEGRTSLIPDRTANPISRRVRADSASASSAEVDPAAKKQKLRELAAKQLRDENEVGGVE